MRIEPHGVGSILHVIKRGARGMDIVRDERDRHRFGTLLFYLNDSFSDPNWIENLKFCRPFERPEHWPEREPLVRILAWTLLSNHFHLLLEEIREGGYCEIHATSLRQHVGGIQCKIFRDRKHFSRPIQKQDRRWRCVPALSRFLYPS